MKSRHVNSFFLFLLSNRTVKNDQHALQKEIVTEVDMEVILINGFDLPSAITK